MYCTWQHFLAWWNWHVQKDPLNVKAWPSKCQYLWPSHTPVNNISEVFIAVMALTAFLHCYKFTKNRFPLSPQWLFFRIWITAFRGSHVTFRGSFWDNYIWWKFLVRIILKYGLDTLWKILVNIYSFWDSSIMGTMVKVEK